MILNVLQQHFMQIGFNFTPLIYLICLKPVTTNSYFSKIPLLYPLNFHVKFALNSFYFSKDVATKANKKLSLMRKNSFNLCIWSKNLQRTEVRVHADIYYWLIKTYYDL